MRVLSLILERILEVILALPFVFRCTKKKSVFVEPHLLVRPRSGCTDALRVLVHEEGRDCGKQRRLALRQTRQPARRQVRVQQGLGGLKE